MTLSPLLDVRSPNWSVHAPTTSAIPLLLHGFGSTERDLGGLVPALKLELPWASLRAPLELGNGGAAWFEIVTPGDPAAEPVVEATDAIWAWVDANVDPSTPVIPIGFSQGGLMASQLLRTRPERVLATVILGGFVLGATQPGDVDIAASRPPVFWGRGAEDRVIGVPAIDRTSAFLPEHSTLVERIYPGLAHGISQDEIDDVSEFLSVGLAGTRRGPRALPSR
jgi:phospholipase/carboxylesterase